MDHTVIQGLYHGKMQFPFFKGATKAFSALMMKEEHNTGSK